MMFNPFTGLVKCLLPIKTMGWYLRKSVGLGPFRFNLSKSGIGYSFGVRGARIGVGARGSYVRVGRGGLYYQKYLNAPRVRHCAASARPATLVASIPQPVSVIQTADVSALQDSSAHDLLNEIQAHHRRLRFAPVILVLFLVGLLSALVAGVSLWVIIAIVVVGATAHIATRSSDYHRKLVTVQYELDGDARKNYLELLKVQERFAGTARLWRVTSKQKNLDTKYTAGAGTSITRKLIGSSFCAPPFFQTSIAIYCMKFDDQSLFFFPDRVLVYGRGVVGAVGYADLSIATSETQYVENEWLPSDTEVVGRTWLYVNKHGGPDRRFSNNRELPIVRYGYLTLTSSSGMNLAIMVSDSTRAAALASAIRQYTASLVSMQSHKGDTTQA